MEKLVLDEIMKLERKPNMTIINSMRMMAKHAPISLKTDENYNLFYECDLQDVLKSDITNEDMMKSVIEGNWEYSADGKNLIRKI